MTTLSRRNIVPATCILIVAMSVLFVRALPIAKAADPDKPSIEITTVPKDGPGGESPREDIAGKAQGADIAKCKVVIYAKTDQWYVQPFSDERALTDIDGKGEWKANISLGHKYAVLLVKPTYKPSATLGKLPAVGDDVLAVAEKDAKKD